MIRRLSDELVPAVWWMAIGLGVAVLWESMPWR